MSSSDSDYYDEFSHSGFELDDQIIDNVDISDIDSDYDEINDDILKSKSGITWSCVKPPTSRTCAENIMNSATGATAYATMKIMCLLDCFLLFFTYEIRSKIISYTNLFGKHFFKDDWWDIDDIELKGYFGALILMAIHKDRQEPLCELFSVAEGREIYRRIFSFRRFRQITRSLHFDDYRTREDRKKDDKFCPIREIWDDWISILPKCYSPNEDVSIDEQLIAFKGRCPFRQYMPMKPANYGLKFFLLVDPITKYISNINVYLGKRNFEALRQCNVGESVVLSLAAPLYHSGRTIVTDNFFSSLSLAEKLMAKSLTFLGTMRKNKKEIPPILFPSKRLLHTSTFVFHGKYMLTSYVSKKNKVVIMLASGTTNDAISGQSTDFKPKVILHYNKTMGGVDTVDRMLASVSTRRFTRRWPLIVFENMIDLSLINAFALFKDIFDEHGKKRRTFLKELAEQLYLPLISRNSTKIIKKRSKKINIPRKKPNFNGKPSRCEFCERSKDRKTSKWCQSCFKYYCPHHASSLCQECQD